MPSSELSMIASFQPRENVTCRGQHRKKKKKKEKKKYNEATRKKKRMNGLFWLMRREKGGVCFGFGKHSTNI